MSYQLGNIILPYPKKFTRSFLETGTKNFLVEGITTQRIENRKEVFTLEYQNLISLQVNSILSEYETNEVRLFTVTEENLSIGPTRVLVNIENRNYLQSGNAYLENLTLILTEVI